MTEHSALINLDSVFDPAPVYERFVALTKLAETKFHSSLAGRLVFCGTVDDCASKTVLAASIAGAATLGVSSDEEQVKQIIRNNVCDFIVNSLDEALRILKNEIRKKLPVAVCLQQDFAETIQEFVTRGVQPDVLALSEEEANAQPDAIAKLVIAVRLCCLLRRSNLSKVCTGVCRSIQCSGCQSSTALLPR